jgi:hypothetical protein
VQVRVKTALSIGCGRRWPPPEKRFDLYVCVSVARFPGRRSTKEKLP